MPRTRNLSRGKVWQWGLKGFLGSVLLGGLLLAAWAQESPRSLRRQAQALLQEGQRRQAQGQQNPLQPLEAARRLYRQLDRGTDLGLRRERAETLRQILKFHGAQVLTLPYAQELEALVPTLNRTYAAAIESHS